MITDINQLDLTKRYTYADYLTWQFDEMVELIRGKVFRMSPAHGTSHQWISGELFFQIKTHLKEKPCQVFTAPFDVRLPLPPDKQSDHKTDTVVQPDISVVCNLSKLDTRGCKGAPDWIIEILSKGTAQKDFNEKFDLYQHAGVREYWIIHPHEQTVLAYTLNESGKYHLIRQKAFVRNERVPVSTFNGLEIILDEIFEDF